MSGHPEWHLDLFRKIQDEFSFNENEELETLSISVPLGYVSLTCFEKDRVRLSLCSNGERSWVEFLRQLRRDNLVHYDACIDVRLFELWIYEVDLSKENFWGHLFEVLDDMGVQRIETRKDGGNVTLDELEKGICAKFRIEKTAQWKKPADGLWQPDQCYEASNSAGTIGLYCYTELFLVEFVPNSKEIMERCRPALADFWTINPSSFSFRMKRPAAEFKDICQKLKEVGVPYSDLTAGQHNEELLIRDVLEELGEFKNKETNMSNEKRESIILSTVETIKEDAVAGAWMAAAHQAVKMTREPALAYLKKRVGSSMATKAGAFLDTDVGEGAFAIALGAALAGLQATHPSIGDKRKVTRLSEELRKFGWYRATSVIAELITGPVRDGLVLLIAGLPEVPAGADDGIKVTETK